MFKNVVIDHGRASAWVLLLAPLTSGQTTSRQVDGWAALHDIFTDKPLVFAILSSGP
jgi:hypothetical protein